MEPGALIFIGVFTWLFSVVMAGLIGGQKNAGVAGVLLGLFFGPLGVIAAFSLDERPRCPRCAGPIDVDYRPRICRWCHVQLDWVEDEDIREPEQGKPESEAGAAQAAMQEEARRAKKATADWEVRADEATLQEQARRANKAAADWEAGVAEEVLQEQARRAKKPAADD